MSDLVSMVHQIWCSQDAAGVLTEKIVPRQKHKPQNDLRHPAA
ncbi:MAG: hypothetical protein NZ658_03670 [Pirellulales bacterium]|nr:hypothetical protein [Pirellulales bacterium]